MAFATFAFVLLVACADGQGGDARSAPDSGVTSSGSTGTSGAGGIGGVGGVGGVVAGVGGVGGVTGVGGDAAGACISPANAREAGAGLATADLDTHSLHVRPTTSLDSTPLGLVAALYAREGGLLVRGHRGFWDVERDAEPARYDSSREVRDLLSADLEGDGDIDVVAIEALAGRDQGDGVPASDRGMEFAYVFKIWERVDGALIARAEQPATGQGVPTHAVGDVEGDGDADLVTFDGGYVIVQRNEGELAFTRLEASARVEGYEGSNHTLGVLLADRNGDDMQDLIVLSYRFDPQSSDVLVFLSDGSGQFLPPTNTKLEVLRTYSGMLGDVTGDGLADVVMVATRQLDDGTFERATFLAESLNATSVSAPVSLGDIGARKLVDFDADGTLDLASFSGFGALTIEIALGAGAFESRRFYLAAHGLDDFNIDPPRDGEVARFVGIYRFECPQPCTPDCNHCVFDACVDACLTPEGAFCPGLPSDGDDDAGMP